LNSSLVSTPPGYASVRWLSSKLDGLWLVSVLKLLDGQSTYLSTVNLPVYFAAGDTNVGVRPTYAGLNQLSQRQVGFITIRRRGSGMLARVSRLPADHWKCCQITQAKGKRRQVKYVDEWIALHGYDDAVRQLIVKGLGHESPTFFLTNDRPQPQTAREVIQTYASRNHVENQLGEQITFFHLDCLCSDVRLNVDFDLTLTVLADLLYRGLAERLKGFAQAGPSRLYRKFVDTLGTVEITAKGLVVRLDKRAHTPLLKEARLMQPTRSVPWLGGRCVQLVCP
jgi:hypothetical protein